MSKTITFFQTALFALTIFAAQATERETRDLSNFHGVSVSSGVDAELIKGDHNEISITVDGIDIERVKTEVKNGVLVVSVKSKNSWFGAWKKKDIDVIITYTDELETLRASSGSKLSADHIIYTDDLEIDISSGANVDLDIDATDVDIDMSSGSYAKIGGVTAVAYVKTSSGATLSAFDLRADKASTKGSSGSSSSITVVNSLRADVSSGASVRYKGNPVETDIDKSSGGSVRQVSSGI